MMVHNNHPSSCDTDTQNQQEIQSCKNKLLLGFPVRLRCCHPYMKRLVHYQFHFDQQLEQQSLDMSMETRTETYTETKWETLLKSSPKACLIEVPLESIETLESNVKEMCSFLEAEVDF